MCHHISSYFAAWRRPCDFWPGKNSAAWGFKAKLASAEWPCWTRKKVPLTSAIFRNDGITKTRSTSINIYQPIYNSLAIGILCHCPSLSIIVSFMPLYSYVKPRESRQPRWIHLSGPTASLAAPATEYQRRLDWHEKVSRLGSWYWERSGGLAWMWLAQESCGNGIKQSQN